MVIVYNFRLGHCVLKTLSKPWAFNTFQNVIQKGGTENDRT